MRFLLPPLLLCLAVPLALPAAPDRRPAAADAGAEVVDLSRFFGDAEGAFVLLDVRAGRTRVHDPERAARRFLPASTYKIPNTLIALETGVAAGPETELAWDSAASPRQPFWPDSWTEPQTLRSAFRNSVYWYYQELARRIGPERTAAWLERFGYGNRDLSPAIDAFWLTGGLRISPEEQVDFLRRLRARELGVSERSTRILEELMLLEETGSYRLLGKTGTADVTPTRELGWLVGWVETGDGAHVYALNMEGERVWEDWPPRKRTELVKAMLVELGVLPKRGP